MTLAAWLHDLSPFAIRFTEGFGIRWYGLSYALGFLVAWLMLRWLAGRGAIPIPRDRVGDAILCAVAGVIVGGRLGYVLVYEPSLLLQFDRGFPWWGLLAINKGGMASHGGIAGVIISAFFIARGFKDDAGIRRGRTSVLRILDALAIVTPPGLLFGRLANFINGELLGRIYAGPGQPAPWWTVKFPQEILVGARGQPPRSDEELRAIERIIDEAGIQARTFDAGYEALMARIQRGDSHLASQLAPLLTSRYPSQLFQGAAEGLILGVFLLVISRTARLPGVIGCWFMIGYGLLRIITEQFWRLPDAHLKNPYPFGLTYGQWLSLAMVAVGMAALCLIVRRGGQKVGGWGTPKVPAPAN